MNHILKIIFFLIIILFSCNKEKRCCDDSEALNKTYIVYTYGLDSMYLGKKYPSNIFNEKKFGHAVDHYEAEECIPDTFYIKFHKHIIKGDTAKLEETYFFCNEEFAVYKIRFYSDYPKKHQRYIKNIMKKLKINYNFEQVDTTILYKLNENPLITQKIIIDGFGNFKMQVKFEDNHFWDHKYK